MAEGVSAVINCNSIIQIDAAYHFRWEGRGFATIASLEHVASALMAITLKQPLHNHWQQYFIGSFYLFIFFIMSLVTCLGLSCDEHSYALIDYGVILSFGLEKIVKQYQYLGKFG